MRTASTTWAITVACASALIALIAAAVAASGGHLSLDSVQHVYEASVGRSVSTQPPAMAAYLVWLGGGQAPADAVVALLTLSALATMAGLLLPLAAGPRRVRSPLAIVVAAVAPSSPLLILYAGVLWKDVVFASALTLSLGVLAFLGLATSPRRVVAALGLVVLVACFALMSALRPQAWVLLPLLVAGAAWTTAERRWRTGAVVLASCVLASLGIAAAVDRSLPGHDGRSTRAALVNLVRFDLAGIERFSGGRALENLGVPADAADEAIALYAPERGDGLSDAPAFVAWLRETPSTALVTQWARAVTAHPRAYLRHRVAAARWLWGLGDPRACLPLHLGIEGLPAQIDALSLPTGLDAGERALYARMAPWFGSAVFRPVAYGLVLLAAAILVLMRGNRSEAIVVVGIVTVASAYGLATSVVSFACDLRYLHPLVPLASMAMLVAAFRWSALDAPERAVSPTGTTR